MRLTYFALVLSLAVGFALTGRGASIDEWKAIAQSGDTSAIMVAAAQAESLWPRDIPGYSAIYGGLIAGLDPQTKGNQGATPDTLRLLQKLTHPLFEKVEDKPRDPPGCLFFSQSTGVSAIIHAAQVPGVSAEDQLRMVEWVLPFLSGLRKRVIPNYAEMEIAFPEPPKEYTGAVFNGRVDPKAIDDPVARAKYEEAIRIYNEHAMQPQLVAVIRDHTMALSGLLLHLAKVNPLVAPQARALWQQVQEIAVIQNGRPPVPPRDFGTFVPKLPL